MPSGIIEDREYEPFCGVALSHAALPIPFSMPRPHQHRDYELFLLLKGGRKFFSANTICTLTDNTAMLIPPNEPHQSTAQLNAPMERYAVYISPKLMNAIFKENPTLRGILSIRLFHTSPETFAKILTDIEAIKQEFEKSDELSQCYIKNLICNLLLILYREHKITDTRNGTEFSPFEKNDIRLQTPINYILEHYAENITLEKCADMAYMSTSHFSRQFHLVTGINFKEYLNKVRINRACELLNSDKNFNMTDLAGMVGFSNSSYFTYIFRTVVGVSPTQYRKNNRIHKSTYPYL